MSVSVACGGKVCPWVRGDENGRSNLLQKSGANLKKAREVIIDGGHGHGQDPQVLHW